ncbi:conjugal transfer protein [Escherichia coli]|uniref:fertility inhibition protein FinO n=1 Tax=Escherichia coli TaxID=562 RepID=UPI000A38FBB5|nr:fertility inhibition protein FinO [Escherichia coli]OUJ64806.1 conjugal transfer protein [Escherichia coli]
MTEQKRPVLTLKRKTEGETPTRSRKTIINVTTPPKWKVKKQKLAEKAAREAELAAKKAQARQALSIYLTLPSLDEAVNTLKPWWPGLFDGNDTEGYVTEHISQEEEAYAAGRLEKIRRQNRTKAELQAVLDGK